MNNPPMTKVTTGVVYSFNVAPDNEHQYYRKPKRSVDDVDRLTAFIRYWTHFMDCIGEYDVEYYLQTELSEPFDGTSDKQSSRLHFHGYIYFPFIDSLKWFLLYGTVLLSKVCTYKIDDINDPVYWDLYVTKQEFLGLPALASGNICLKETSLNSQAQSGEDVTLSLETKERPSPPPPTEIKTIKTKRNKKTNK